MIGSKTLCRPLATVVGPLKWIALSCLFKTLLMARSSELVKAKL